MKYNFNGVFGPDLCGIATSGFFAGGHFGFFFSSRDLSSKSRF